MIYNDENLEIAETYCEKALCLQEDKYDTYMQIGMRDIHSFIGEIFKDYNLELCIKYYEGARC